MKKLILVLFAALALPTLAASKLAPMRSEYFKVTPAVLEAEQGRVEVTIDGLFPEKYMEKKAVLTVTPELRYMQDGQLHVLQGQPASFQGEKVQGNDQVVNYKLGGHYTLKAIFPYSAAMHKSELYVSFQGRVGNKAVQLAEVKLADGVVATSELYRQTLSTARPSLSAYAFQRNVAQKLDANVKFLIEQAELRKSELKNNSVQEFVSLLQRIAGDRERLSLTNVQVSAYASPDGGYALNEKLANKRQTNTEKYVRQQLDKVSMDGDVEASYTAQDWEGFQQLVKASDIQDKDVILRVLSMYQDPEEREQQIKNMSHGFRELAEGILPELRRARLTINYEAVGRSDAQIMEQLRSDASQLSVEELLYAASLAKTPAEQESIYKTAASQYPQDVRACNNLGALAFAGGDYDAARQWLEKAAQVDGRNTEVNANLGLLALQRGDTQAAENYIGRAANASNLAEVLGNLHLAQGNYALAEQDFANVQSNSAALAQLLNQNYAKASQTLRSVKQPNAMTDYLQAVVAARQGDAETSATFLRSALQKDPSLRQYAEEDQELVIRR